MSARATAFLIWRAGESVNWECTAQDIADEIGKARQTVWAICSEKGWRLQSGHDGSGGKNIHAIDSIMKSPHMQRGGEN